MVNSNSQLLDSEKRMHVYYFKRNFEDILFFKKMNNNRFFLANNFDYLIEQSISLDPND